MAVTLVTTIASLLHNYYSCMRPWLDTLKKQFLRRRSGKLGHGTGSTQPQTSRKRGNQLGHRDLHVPVSRRSSRCALLFHLESAIRRRVSLVGFGKPGYRDELSPPAYPPRLQDLQVGG